MHITILPLFLFAISWPTSIACAMWCSYSDPGILPRSSSVYGSEEKPIPKDVLVKGFPVHMSYCSIFHNMKRTNVNRHVPHF